MIVGITDRSLYKEEGVYHMWIDHFLQSPKVDFLIIREKDLSLDDYDKLIEKILDRNTMYKDKIRIHTHDAIAMKHGIDRLHLPEYLINRSMPKNFKLSYSTHPKTHNLDYIYERCDFFLVSPVLATTCKPGARAIDRKLLSKLNVHYGDKMVLLGGLDATTIESFKKEGFRHFALRSQLECYIGDGPQSDIFT